MHGTAHASGAVHGPVLAPAAADDAAVPAGRIKKKRTLSIQCSPSKFRDLVKALDDDLKDAIRAKNFGPLLDFKPSELDRKLLSWLMRRLNADTMQLELGGDQRISITQHSVWCVLQIPRDGGGPPEMTDEAARLRQRQLAASFFGRELNSISPPEIQKLFEDRKLTGEIGLRTFFMCAFQCLLFSNTSCYIRLDDIKYTQDVKNIGHMNWCKVVVDNLSRSARLYKVDFESKGLEVPISGCGIFLVMLYIDFLQHGYDLNPFAFAWCAYVDSKIIDKISLEDCRGDVARGVLEFGHIRLKNINDTCYRLPHPALAVGGAPIAPGAPFQRYSGPSASAGTSHDVAPTSHDPGVSSASAAFQAGFNLQAPAAVSYPSLSAVFGQGLIDVVGRSRNSQAQKLLEDYNASASEAHSFMAEAVNYVNKANALMSKCQHEFYTGVQKLLEDTRSDKIATNAVAINAARRAKPKNDRASSAQTHDVSDADKPGAENREERGSAGMPHAEMPPPDNLEERCADREQRGAAGIEEELEDADPYDEEPLDVEHDDIIGSGAAGDQYMDGTFSPVSSEEDRHGIDKQTPSRCPGYDDPVISTPTALRGPSSGVDTIISQLCGSHLRPA
ncbi:unnamed protein product [Urochloa humidicola]